MKTLRNAKLMLLALMFTGCAVEMEEQPYIQGLYQGQDATVGRDADPGVDLGQDVTEGTDASVGMDTDSTDAGSDVASTDTDAGQDTDLGQDVTEGTDTDLGQDTQEPDTTPEPTIACNAPTNERLVNLGNGLWHDKLLNIDCTPRISTMGLRCFPDVTKQGHTVSKPTMEIAFAKRYADSECKVWIYDVKVDDKPKFYAHVSKGVVVEINGTMDPPADNVTIKNEGKPPKPAMYLKQTYEKTATGCQAKGEYWPLDYMDKYVFKYDAGPASIPQCPGVTGMALFAEMAN